VSTLDRPIDAMSMVSAAVTSGRCILFLGAGVHYPPPDGSPYAYPPEDRPPLGGALAESLGKACGFAERFPHDSPTNLQRVALCYETVHGRHALVKAIEEAVLVGKKPSAVLRALARLPFPLVATTNYDNLFERALAAFGDKEPYVSVYDATEHARAEDVDDPTPERPFLFKVHGDVKRPESIVVTDEDYIQFVLRMSEPTGFGPIPETFLYRFRTWPTLFVGYSLLDYNLRLLFKTLRWRVDPARFPAAFSVDLKPDPLIVAVWDEQRRFVKFISQDVWTFVPALYREVLGEDMPP
jgi:hypothetical protein